MRKLLLLSLTFLSLTANAQLDVFSEQLYRPTTVDTAGYKVTYALDYTCHPQADVRFKDVRDVLIGRHSVKDFSDVIFHYDSLATEDMRKGRDAFFNPKGTPWPVEVLLSAKGKHADVKRRLPSGMGTLSYRDSVPTFVWEFVADTTRTILGYECQLATTRFAGRDYSAWYTPELPLPYGPYKFGGLPGLIVRIQDAESQFVWSMTGFERSDEPIIVYEYSNEKKCTAEEADKTVRRYYEAPLTVQLAAIGGGKGRIMIVGKDGKTRDATEVEDTPIPYKPLETR